MTIYLVEDDATIAGAVASHLRAWGYDCVVAADFRDVAGEFQRLQPQLVLLDLLLPFYNGFHWCQEIRRTSQVPILFLSSALPAPVFPATGSASVCAFPGPPPKTKSSTAAPGAQ